MATTEKLRIVPGVRTPREFSELFHDVTDAGWRVPPQAVEDVDDGLVLIFDRPTVDQP